MATARKRVRTTLGIVEVPTGEPDPLADYPAVYLESRVDGHTWGPATWELVKGNVSIRWRQCTGCGMLRGHTINTRTWTRMAMPTKYRPPRGYSMRGQGLVHADYVKRHLAADFERAQKAGQVG